VTPPVSPIRTQREFGTSSSGITPELREILDMHHSEIVSLKEFDQQKEQTSTQILNVLCDIQKRLPNT
jgi:Fe-S-cluster formation regulator IscX/YfhJ